jgi:hypothetical protein
MAHIMAASADRRSPEEVNSVIQMHRRKIQLKIESLDLAFSQSRSSETLLKIIQDVVAFLEEKNQVDEHIRRAHATRQSLRQIIHDVRGFSGMFRVPRDEPQGTVDIGELRLQPHQFHSDDIRSSVQTVSQLADPSSEELNHFLRQFAQLNATWEKMEKSELAIGKEVGDCVRKTLPFFEKFRDELSAASHRDVPESSSSTHLVKSVLESLNSLKDYLVELLQNEQDHPEGKMEGGDDFNQKLFSHFLDVVTLLHTLSAHSAFASEDASQTLKTIEGELEVFLSHHRAPPPFKRMPRKFKGLDGEVAKGREPRLIGDTRNASEKEKESGLLDQTDTVKGIL